MCMLFPEAAWETVRINGAVKGTISHHRVSGSSLPALHPHRRHHTKSPHMERNQKQRTDWVTVTTLIMTQIIFFQDADNTVLLGLSMDNNSLQECHNLLTYLLTSYRLSSGAKKSLFPWIWKNKRNSHWDSHPSTSNHHRQRYHENSVPLNIPQTANMQHIQFLSTHTGHSIENCHLSK